MLDQIFSFFEIKVDYDLNLMLPNLSKLLLFLMVSINSDLFFQERKELIIGKLLFYPNIKI